MAVEVDRVSWLTEGRSNRGGIGGFCCSAKGTRFAGAVRPRVLKFIE